MTGEDWSPELFPLSTLGWAKTGTVLLMCRYFWGQVRWWCQRKLQCGVGLGCWDLLRWALSPGACYRLGSNVKQHRAQRSLGLRGQVPQATDVKGRHHPVSSMPSHHQHFPGRELLGFGWGSFFVSKTGLSRSSGMAVWFRWQKNTGFLTSKAYIQGSSQDRCWQFTEMRSKLLKPACQVAYLGELSSGGKFRTNGASWALSFTWLSVWEMLPLLATLPWCWELLILLSYHPEFSFPSSLCVYRGELQRSPQHVTATHRLFWFCFTDSQVKALATIWKSQLSESPLFFLGVIWLISRFFLFQHLELYQLTRYGIQGFY